MASINITPAGQLVTKTYQKPMNLYLYLPPTSAHNPAIFKGMIYGMLYRYWQQNTTPPDFQQMVKLLFHRLLQCGHHQHQLEKWFRDSAKCIDDIESGQKQSHSSMVNNQKERLFLHVKYHPATIPSKSIHELFNQHCRHLIQNTTK